MIRPPRSDELDRLREIERAAGRAFAEIGMPEIAADEPPSPSVLERYRAAGRAWVATVASGPPVDAGSGVASGPGAAAGGTGAGPVVDAGDAVVAGYLLVDVLDAPGPDAPTERSAHVEQVSVDPQFARRRIGAQLIDHVADEARRRGLAALTLTTFRDVAWNAPYYERCGFRMLADDELGPGLRRVRADEAAHGLDPTRRVCMRREL